MIISEMEATSNIWKKVEAEVTERLTTFREKNDGQYDAVETARLRGQIAMCKEILSWPTSTTNQIRD